MRTQHVFSQGGIVWALLYGIGSFILGSNIHRLAGPVGIGTSVVAGILVVTFVIFLWRNERRLEDEAEKALPGAPGDNHRARSQQ